MKVVVTGGRKYADKDALFAAMDRVHEQRPITKVIHGGATGADCLAGKWARSRGIDCDCFHADWGRHGKAAGPIRNAQMLQQEPRIVIAFPGGRGTENMIYLAIAAGVHVIRFGEGG